MVHEILETFISLEEIAHIGSYKRENKWGEYWEHKFTVMFKSGAKISFASQNDIQEERSKLIEAFKRCSGCNAEKDK